MVPQVWSAAPPLDTSSSSGWAVLADPRGGGIVNVTVGAQAFGFLLSAVVELPAAGAGAGAGAGAAAPTSVAAVLERNFARWGFVSFVAVSDGAKKDATSTDSSAEVARLRKSTGRVYNLSMPNYAYLAAEKQCGYYSAVYDDPTDYIGQAVMAETDGEATYLSAAKYLPPQRDYASIGAVDPYNKFSVSPDGRLKIADSDIYTPTEKASDVGPGVLVFDPRNYADFWPATNWTFLKSGLLGGHLRVISTVGFDVSTGRGFEQIAFAPASEPAASAYIRLRSTNGDDSNATAVFSYFNATSAKASGSADIEATVSPLQPAAFYLALLAEQQLWNATLAPSAVYRLPGQEGRRQTDTAAGALVASLSLFVGLQPNYGDGADYWSPQINRGGSLPFQEIAVVQNLLDLGLSRLAADRLGWYFDNYITPEGNLTTGDWETSCPDGFADALADWGEVGGWVGGWVHVWMGNCNALKGRWGTLTCK